MPRLILVTDRRLMGDDLPGAIALALQGAPAGTTWVQLREKDLGGRELWALASAAREVCHAAGARLLVNDRIDIALAAGADGVAAIRAVWTAHDPAAAVRAILGLA